MKWFLPLVLGLLLAGCAKNEIKLSFDLPADYNQPCRLLYYSTGKEGDIIKETVVDIREGKGESILPLKKPSIMYIFSAVSKYPVLILYVERGDNIKISGKSGAVEEWKVSGSKISEEVNEWRLKNLALIKEKEDSPEKLNKAVAKYVEDNPDSFASAIILYFYFTRLDREKEFYKLQAKLSKDVTGNDLLMQALSMPDIITGLPEEYKIPKELVFTTDSGYADTLKLARGKASLLIFRNTFPLEVPMDTIKSVVKKTKGKNVVELFMDADSAQWRRYLRRDTIKGMTRMWLPLGLADTVVIKMGIRRIPQFMVTDGKGREVYKGSDWERALKKFENINP